MGRSKTPGTWEARKTAASKARFLAALVQYGRIVRAARVARIARETHYQWLKRDPAYAEAFRAATEQIADRMEDELYRRGVEGVEKPVYQNGRKVGTIREYSDACLIFGLKAVRPEKYQSQSRVIHEGEVTLSIARAAETVRARILRLVAPGDSGGVPRGLLPDGTGGDPV